MRPGLGPRPSNWGSVAQQPLGFLSLLPDGQQLQGQHGLQRQAASHGPEMEPLKVVEIILNHPYFGGVERNPRSNRPA